jgi:hypothetical protein
MKRNIILFSALCLSTIITAQNGANIEYKITSSKGANGTVKINYSEFGSGSEFNMVIPQMPGGGITVKSLSSKSKPDVIYTINDKNKTYSEVKKTESSADDTKTYTVKKIGEEKINGYKCIHALVTEGNETHEVWNTKDVAEFSKYAEGFSSNKKISSTKRDQALKDAGCDGLPVKQIHKGNEREGDMTMELVKIEKKSFSKSDFDIPAGYTKSETGAGAVTNGMKSQEEIMKMTPEERTKYIEEMKKKYGK